MYWLERLGVFVLFCLALYLCFSVVEAKLPAFEKYQIIPVVLIAGIWAFFDYEVMYRYGRRKRIKEIVAELEAEDAAKGLASLKAE